MQKNGLSIVIPFLNEHDGIELFCSELDQYAGKMNFLIELVFVDDGSDDNTQKLIKNYNFNNIDKVKIIEFSKNFGSHAAIRAGVKNAYFDNCTWMGSDLQEPIEFLKLGYDKLQEGYDAVYIEKKTINISFISRLFSKTYAFLMRKFAVKNFALGGVSNIVFNKRIKTFLNHNIESNSAINLQIMDAGFKNYTYSMDFKQRGVGKSKWTLSKKIKLFIDSFVAFSFMPIRMVSVMGILMFIAGIFFGLFIIINKLVNPQSPLPGYSTIASLIAIGFGVTNISLGIIAEYLWRTYDASRGRPAFIISDIIDIKDDTSAKEDTNE